MFIWREARLVGWFLLFALGWQCGVSARQGRGRASVSPRTGDGSGQMGKRQAFVPRHDLQGRAFCWQRSVVPDGLIELPIPYPQHICRTWSASARGYALEYRSATDVAHEILCHVVFSSAILCQSRSKPTSPFAEFIVPRNTSPLRFQPDQHLFIGHYGSLPGACQSHRCHLDLHQASRPSYSLAHKPSSAQITSGCSLALSFRLPALAEIFSKRDNAI